MRRRAERGTRGALEQGDAKAVDLLLRVASGPDLCAELPREEALRLRTEFAPLVQLAIDAPDRLYEQEYSRRLRELVHDGLTIKPVAGAITLTGRSRAVYAWHYRDTHAELSHGVLNLLDDQLSYGDALCRCKLPNCRRFYLARRNPNGGPANRTYCSPGHRDEHHNSAHRKAAAKKPRKHK